MIDIGTRRKVKTVSVTVSIELDADKDTARRMVEQAGFTVTRVATKRVTSKADSGATSARFGRANVYTDMPPGLTGMEEKAYIRGYAKGCMRYTRKHGAPAIQGLPVDKDELRRMTIAHGWDQQPTAHRAGMAELRRWREKYPTPVVAVAS